MIAGWVSLAAFAREHKVNPRTMRRRLVALAQQRGWTFLRASKGPPRPGLRPGRYEVHPERLKSELEKDPDAHRAELDSLAEEIERLRESVEALKTWRKALKRQGFFRTPKPAIGLVTDSCGHELPPTL